MSKIEILAAVSAIGIIGLASSAEAFSIINRDAAPHVLTIIEGDDQREVRVEPYGQASGLCRSPCDVSVDYGPDLYEVATSDALSIEDGELLDADEPTEEPTEDPIGDPIDEPTEAPTE